MNARIIIIVVYGIYYDDILTEIFKNDADVERVAFFKSNFRVCFCCDLDQFGTFWKKLDYI